MIFQMLLKSLNASRNEKNQSDISGRKEAEARIQRLTQLYAALSHCNQAIVRCTGEEALFSEICRVAVQFGGMKMAWIGMLDPDGGLIRTAASSGMSAEYLDGIKITLVDCAPSERDPVGIAVREDRPIWCQDYAGSPYRESLKERAACHGWSALAALPLHRRGVVVGVFTLYAGEIDAFDENAQGLLGEMARDISFALDNFWREDERQQAESQLQLAAKVFEQSREGFLITDADNRIVMVNRAFTEITGYKMADIIGRGPSLFSSGHQKPDFYQPMWEDVNTRGRWQGEVLNRKSDGSLYLAWLSISRMLNAEGMPTHYIGILSDITKHKAAEEHLHWLTHFDTLTGLPNRTLLEDRCSHAIGMSQRVGKPLALLFLDIDNFKNTNDSLGYRVGDELLSMVAKRLTSILREQDTVSRIGGDDFVIVLPGTDVDDAEKLSERLLAEVTAPFIINRHELSITASIGIAMFPDNGGDLDSLSKCADAAMYRAKYDGRNTYRFFTPEIQAYSFRRLQLENALRHALERNQFMLHYQPQVDLKENKVIGAEALLRWQHPEFGMVPPSEFISIAENSGLILPIGEWVLRTATRQLKDWMDQGVAPMTISVNISAVQFRYPRLPELIMEILDEVGLPPQFLELELTESVAMENPLAAIEVMNDLHRHGIRMSIDDFGTGYSSLGHLKNFKAYKLKIDRSFVCDLANDRGDRAIVGAIINLAGSLGLQTIAEGAETEEQIGFLRESGCDEIQGYYFSRPLPPDQFEKYLVERKIELAA
jgi:diguanylate cyclase (GGDEF)-like protein/PAS domain S-box-containing protein